MSTAADWFHTDLQFRQFLADAQSRAQTDRGIEFAAQMIVKAKTHGLATFLSEKQLTWLAVLAGVMPPPRVTPGRPA